MKEKVRNLNEQHKESVKDTIKAQIKNLIEEHKDLNARIERLQNFIYNLNNHLLDMNDKTPEEAKRDCMEYANLTIQLRGMKMYRDALTARLLNAGIIIKDGHYMTEVE